MALLVTERHIQFMASLKPQSYWKEIKKPEVCTLMDLAIIAVFDLRL